MTLLPVSIYKVKDNSMIPTILDGDYVISIGWYGNIRRGDIVVLRHPAGAMRLVKRVERVDADSVYVVGDNRAESEDSRNFGAVKRQSLLGKVVAVI
jgi:nickel-type superoxide dismutase maturation protease